MMLVFNRVGEVHIARVPLITEGWDAVHPPMDEDAELGIQVSVRYLVNGQRFPGKFICIEEFWHFCLSRYILFKIFFYT